MADPTTIPSCSDCGAQIPVSAERWPSASTGVVCQVCWEAQCSRQWWALVRLLPEEGPMPDPTADLLDALSAAQFALIEAGEAIQRLEGYSRARSRAANASHAARNAVDRYRMATNTN